MSVAFARDTLCCHEVFGMAYKTLADLVALGVRQAAGVGAGSCQAGERLVQRRQQQELHLGLGCLRLEHQDTSASAVVGRQWLCTVTGRRQPVRHVRHRRRQAPVARLFQGHLSDLSKCQPVRLRLTEASACRQPWPLW